jgi:microcystin degradation protein MlrC
MARIAHAGFLHETNTFAPLKATWDDFLRAESFPGLTLGDEILSRFPTINIGTGGFVREAPKLGHEPLPIAWCGAVPSAHVEEEAFENFSKILLDGLAELGDQVDAIYLDLHGAMVCEHTEDGEGELLRRVREQVGPDMPVVVSLDLHSNTTDLMVENCDALVAYRTYPHLDMADTGIRAAHVLDQIIKTGQKPAKARRAVPFLMPLTGQCTMVEPMAGVYRLLEDLEAGDGMQVMSFTPGFPPADIWDCGPVVLAYGDTQEAADAAADALLQYILDRETSFQVPFLSPEEAVGKAIASNAHKPYVLADVQDNCGAGASSDTTGLLRAMVEQNADGALIGLIVDPETAAAAHAAGEGAEIDLEVGGKLYEPGGPPFRGRFVVEKLTDGQFTCTGPFYKGATPNLGPTALLRIGGVSVLVSSRRMQAADKEIFRHAGMEPSKQKILGLKSTVHFRGDFTDIAEEILCVEAPGAANDQPETFDYRHLRPGVRLCPNGPVYESKPA